MTSYPLMVQGDQLSALVVGGGQVAFRKVTALVECGASVRVVATEIGRELRTISAKVPLVLVERPYESEDIGSALLVIAATSVREVNQRVAADARALGRLVNVVDVSEEGNCVTTASHRAGSLVMAVSTGRLPRAAARIRDRVSAPFDFRYAEVLAALTDLRTRLLSDGAHGSWHEAEHTLIAPDFCDAVESGTLLKRVRRWA